MNRIVPTVVGSKPTACSASWYASSVAAIGGPIVSSGGCATPTACHGLHEQPHEPIGRRRIPDCKRQPPARTQQPSPRGQGLPLVGEVMEREVADDRIEGSIRERRRGGVPDNECEPRVHP